MIIVEKDWEKLWRALLGYPCSGGQCNSHVHMRSTSFTQEVMNAN